MRLHLKFRSKKSAEAKSTGANSASAVAEPEEGTAPSGHGSIGSVVKQGPVVKGSGLMKEGGGAKDGTAVKESVGPAAVSHGAPRIKTYVAGSVGQAMATARRELGEEAILIYSKRIEDSTDPKRQYEITFGVIHETVKPTPAAPLRPAVEETAPVPEVSLNKDAGMAQEFALMRQEIYALRTMLARSAWGNGSVGNSSECSSHIYTLLVQQGLDPNLATEAALAVEEHTSADGDEIGERALAALAGFLSSHVLTDCSLGWDQSAGKATVLMGPSGSGKTTALVKLALEYGIKRGRPVEIFSLDRQKTEPSRTLEAPAVMLNIPYRPLGSIEALAAALNSKGDDNTLILADTSGFGSGSIDRDRELADLLQAGARADVHLVLPATWHPASIRRAVDRFEIFQPSRLLFTMLDQAGVTGLILQEAWRTGKPLSFFNDGALGCGNIQPASLENVLRGMELAAGVESRQ